MSNFRAAVAVADDSLFRNPSKWNRKANLPRGHRFYSNPEWVRWISGEDDRFDQSGLFDLPAKYWVLDLSEEQDDGRLMSLNERLERYNAIRWYFADVAAGHQYRDIQMRRTGAPFYLENHGPSAERMASARAIWTTLPKNDSEIFARKVEPSKQPNLSHLADQLKPLLSWRHMRVSLSLDSTNWLQADNDNHFDGEQVSPKAATNLERRIRPGSSDAELKSFIQKVGPCREIKHARLGGGGDSDLIPDDTEWATVVDKYKKDGKPEKTHRVMVRAGKLRLSNGKRKVAGVRAEEGTILFQPDKFGELLGPEPDDKEKRRRLSYWSSLMSWDSEIGAHREMEPIKFKRGGRMRRKVKMTRAEQLETLATQPHPPIKHFKPGLPCGAEDIGAQFVGGWVSATKGNQPPERWQDVSDELARQAEFDRWFDALPPEQRKALDLALIAANLREIGEAFGKTGKNAERYGKSILIAGNNNLRKIQAA